MSSRRWRWQVEVHYRIDNGMLLVDHDLSELFELHDLIERGPHWDTIEKIIITRADPIHPYLTVEQAEKI